MPQTQSEVSVYRTVHDIKGYQYLRTIALDIYTHFLNVNGGLPLFLPDYYLHKITDSIVHDTLFNEDTDALQYFERLTGFSRDELIERSDGGSDVDLDSFIADEMDEVVTARFEEQQEWFVSDVQRILDDERITFFLPEDDDEFRYELTFLATNGELTLFRPLRSTIIQPYKGGGFSCLN